MIGSHSAESEFALRSAHYLAESGCTPTEIVAALVEQLELDPCVAAAIVDSNTVVIQGEVAQ